MISLAQTVILLAAAVIAVSLFRFPRLCSILGYVAAGLVIGPWGLNLIGDIGSITHVAEFGVVLLLFIIGLELQPTRLWVMRRLVFGLGGAQVLCARCCSALLAWACGQPPAAAAVIGFGLSLSSTPLVLQVLAERGQLTPSTAAPPSASCCSRTWRSCRCWRCCRCCRRRRGAQTRRRRAWLALLEARGRGGDRHRRRAAAAAPGAAGRGAGPRQRGVHRRGAAHRDRHRAAGQCGRAVDVARRLPRRRAARRQRVPPRAGGRHRAVQGTAARAVLHRASACRPTWACSARAADAAGAHGRVHGGQDRRGAALGRLARQKGDIGAGASPSRCRRAASSRSCCSRSRPASSCSTADRRPARAGGDAVDDARTAAADRRTRPSRTRWLPPPTAPLRRHRRPRDIPSSSPASAASGRSWRACCASRASRSPRSTQPDGTSTSCAASATRSITAMPRAWTCCAPRARRPRRFWCSRSTTSRPPCAPRCWCASSSRS